MKKWIALCSLLLVPSFGFAQDSCAPEEQDYLDICIEDATASCLEEVPSCDVAASDPLEEVRSRVEDRCVFKSNGDPKPEKACKACIASIKRDLAKGPSKYLFPQLAGQIKDILSELNDECGVPVDSEEGDVGDGEGDGGTTPPTPVPTPNKNPGERFCQEHPRLPECMKK